MLITQKPIKVKIHIKRKTKIILVAVFVFQAIFNLTTTVYFDGKGYSIFTRELTLNCIPEQNTANPTNPDEYRVKHKRAYSDDIYFDEKVLQKIKRFVNLKHLMVNGGDFKTLENLDFLQGQNNLESLALNLNTEKNFIHDLEPFREMKKLRVLKIVFTEDENSEGLDISAIRELPNIAMVSFYGTKIKDCTPLLDCPDLNWIEVDENVLPEEIKAELEARGVYIIMSNV